MKRSIYLFLILLVFAGCANPETQNDQPTPVSSELPPTQTVTAVPSSTATIALPTPTNTSRPTLTPPYWWNNQETIGFVKISTGSVYLAGLNGHPAQSIPPSTTLVWSPDGTKIAFNEVNYNISDLKLYDIYSYHIDRLTNYDGERVSRASWSPDGAQIAYATSDGVHIITLDGEEVLHLPSPDYYEVKWSPDGNYLVIERVEWQGSDYDYDLLLYSFATQIVVPIAKTDFLEWFPSWSPDGKKIVFSRDWNMESSDMFIFDIETGRTNQLTSNYGINTFPSWSPDGTMIAFEHREGSLLMDIYMISSDGGEPVQISNFAGSEDWPVWSPDGQKIAFSFISNPDYGEELNSGQVQMESSGIWVYDFGSELFIFIEGSEDGITPAWRPVIPAGD